MMIMIRMMMMMVMMVMMMMMMMVIRLVRASVCEDSNLCSCGWKLKRGEGPFE